MVANSNFTAHLDRPASRAHSTGAWVALVTVLAVLGFVGPVLPAALSAHSAPASPLVAPAATVPAPTSASALLKASASASPPPTSPSLTLAHFQIPGPHLSSWGPAGIPPGAEALGSVLASSAHPTGGSSNWDNRFCAGVWPYGINDSSSQSFYASGCYGHDEPGIEFYSALPGSGGNATWNVTLPVDRSPTENQSNLYSAIWFGMTLNDQLGWLHQCFLELQFYPDQTWTNPSYQTPTDTVNGAWVGAAVAWQIEAATGYEDPCFYQPLFNGTGSYGAGYFDMTQGDQLTVTMNGWVGSPYGENLTIRDWTQNSTSVVNLWDPYGNYPLDPSYATNSFENGLQWTPGGEYPIAFAFETGHAGNPDWPSSNDYGGCSPGKPPATVTYPDVPCPSYDSSSWANDTLSPWQIGVPTFYNAGATDRPAQVAFTQDFGGVLALSDIGGGACDGQVGSAWCTYPWYSYSCLSRSFNFGATDYPGVSADFGQFYEYSQTLEMNGLGFGYFPPTNFSIPTCGATSYAVGVGTNGSVGGSVYFLSRDVPAGTFPNLLPGSYSIYPYAPPGSAFDHWAVAGNLSLVGAASDPWATLIVAGDGTIRAIFVTTPTLTTVTLQDWGTTVPGTIVLSPERTYTNGTPIGTFANGSSVQLPAGVYGVQALASSGAVFSGWSEAGAGASIEPVDFPYSWLDVSGTGGSITLTAHYAPSNMGAVLYVQAYGAGNLTFNGTTTDYFLAANVTVGAYPVSAVPNPGWTFGGWQYYGSAAMTDFDAATSISLENGSSWLFAIFTQIPVPVSVTLNDSPAIAGNIGVGAPFPLSSGSVLPELPGVYSLVSYPAYGYRFANWTVSNTSAVWVLDPTTWQTVVQVNLSATITANWLPAPMGNLSFAVVPASAGFIEFNAVAYSNGDYNGSVTMTNYLANAYPFPGWQLVSLTGSFGVSTTPISGGIDVFFGGNPGTLTATFAPTLVPVSFAATAQVDVQVDINGTTVSPGGTIWLPAGSYSVDLSYGAVVGGYVNELFLGWTSTPGLLLANPNVTATTLTVGVFNPGTIIAILDGPLSVAATASPPAIDLGGTTTLGVAAAGGAAPLGYSWAYLPPGCTASGPSATCTPTSPGSFDVEVFVTDAYGLTVLSGITVQVNPLPAISALTAAPSELDVGSTTVLTTSVTGGTAPITYLYSGLPTGCASADASSISCTPSAPGAATVTATVWDLWGEVATSTVSLTIDAAPAVTALTATPTALDVGMTTELSATATGTGTLSYAWSGLPAGCTSSNSATISCTPTAAGATTVVVTMTDSVGGSASRGVALSVAPRPTVAANLGASPIDFGATTWVNVTASGGTGGLLVTYAGLPTGCTSANTTSLACTPTEDGTFAITVTVTDGLHQSANATVSLTVSAPSGTSGGNGLTSADVAAIVIVVLLVVAVAVFWMTRRRPKAPSDSTTGPTGSA